MKTLFHSHPPFSSTPFSLSPLLDHRRRLRRLRAGTGFNVPPTEGEGGFKRGRWGIRGKEEGEGILLIKGKRGKENFAGSPGRGRRGKGGCLLNLIRLL